MYGTTSDALFRRGYVVRVFRRRFSGSDMRVCAQDRVRAWVPTLVPITMATVGEMAPGCVHTTPVCISSGIAPVGEIAPGCDIKPEERTFKKTIAPGANSPTLTVVCGTIFRAHAKQQPRCAAAEKSASSSRLLLVVRRVLPRGHKSEPVITSELWLLYNTIWCSGMYMAIVVQQLIDQRVKKVFLKQVLWLCFSA